MTEITAILSFPDGTEASVKMARIPRQGEFISTGNAQFEIEKVVYVILDFQESKPDHPHESSIRISLCPQKEDRKTYS